MNGATIGFAGFGSLVGVGSAFLAKSGRGIPMVGFVVVSAVTGAFEVASLRGVANAGTARKAGSCVAGLVDPGALSSDRSSCDRVSLSSSERTRSNDGRKFSAILL